MKKHTFVLTELERDHLQGVLKKGHQPAWLTRRAQSLLAMDAGGPAWPDKKVFEAYRVPVRTCEQWRKQIRAEGVKSLLVRKAPEQPRHAPSLNGEGQARLTALACSAPPEGQVRWTLKLLTERLIALEVVETISDETVRRELKKVSLSLGK